MSKPTLMIPSNFMYNGLNPEGRIPDKISYEDDAGDIP
jgi:hypothetical protein